MCIINRFLPIKSSFPVLQQQCSSQYTQEQKGGELSDKELENVAGGMFWKSWW